MPSQPSLANGMRIPTSIACSSVVETLSGTGGARHVRRAPRSPEDGGVTRPRPRRGERPDRISRAASVPRHETSPTDASPSRATRRRPRRDDGRSDPLDVAPHVALSTGRRLVVASAAVVAVLVAGTIGYRLLGLGWLEALYQAVTTVTTVGFREVGHFGRAEMAFTIVLILVGVGTVLYALHRGDRRGARR